MIHYQTQNIENLHTAHLKEETIYIQLKIKINIHMRTKNTVQIGKKGNNNKNSKYIPYEF